ncbi:hypothetical protein WKW79_15210 [Variovorax robiniae]|uniref:Uncharacterized protein n=1 Tax=Variovorax robiniae TaxID=1836199 RepID=A0ABU8X7W4_9BURK
MALSKDARERLIFEHFARTMGLLPHGTFTSQPEPEPDILYVAADGTSQAFELVEIIDQDYSASLGQSFITKDACNAYLDNLPAPQATAFRSAFRNADIALTFCDNMSGRRRKNALPAIFRHLAVLPDGFTGDVFKGGNPLKTILSYAHIGRGSFAGPIFNTTSVTWVGDPSVDALKGKMAKRYTPQGQLNLLAYIDGNPMFPDDVWLADLEDYLGTLDTECQFARIFIYDCGTSTVKRTWQRSP